MENDILVSVVIPAYNADDFIHGCLDATTHQTYSNIEIIIVDDGSQDATVITCNNYAEEDSRIKVYSIHNSGVSAARNYGLDKACGDYVVFFDADDRPERDLIASYLNAMKQWNGRQISFVACGMFFDNMLNRFAEDKISVLEPVYGFIPGENYLLKRSYAPTLAWLDLFNFVTNKIYDLKKIREYGLHFKTNIHVGEDLTFNLDYLEKCDGYIGMINRPLYHYIKRSEGRLSVSYHESDLKNTKAIYKRFLDWEARQEGVTEDNMMVLEALAISGWINRLSAIRDSWEKDRVMHRSVKNLDREISSEEFQKTLKKVRRAGRIGPVKYYSLRTGNFAVYCFFRKIFQRIKG